MTKTAWVVGADGSEKTVEFPVFKDANFDTKPTFGADIKWPDVLPEGWFRVPVN